MAKLLKLRRGTTSQHSSFTGAEGEVTVDTTKDTAVVHDGSTTGGRPLLREDLDNMPASGVSAGTYGSSSAIPSLTVDAKGRVTGATTTAIDSTAITHGTSSVSVANNGDITLTRAGSTQATVDSSGIKLGDNRRLAFGGNSDLKIHHDGNNSYIIDQGTGNLFVQGNLVAIQSTAGETIAKFTADGASVLNYDGADKLATKSDGVDITGELQCDSLDVDGSSSFAGHLNLNDGFKLRLGTHADLDIYHDGGNSWVREQGNGALYIDSNGSAVIISKSGASEKMAAFYTDGAAELYHNNSKKFETVSGGATVTGTLTATTLEGDGVVPAGAILMWSGAQNAIPSGYVICDGNNGTPNLFNRFIVGAGSSYAVDATGGSANTTLGTSNLPGHSHSTPNHTHTIAGHTHSTPNHSHVVDNHTHSTPNHSHGVNAHSHSTPNHNHNMNSHSHSTSNAGAHSHNVTFWTDSRNYTWDQSNKPMRGYVFNSSGNYGTSNAGGHSHNTNSAASNTNASGGGNTGNAGANTSTSGGSNTGGSAPNTTSGGGSNTGSTALTTASGGGSNTGSTGSGTAFDNRPPYYALCYIMKT